MAISLEQIVPPHLETLAAHVPGELAISLQGFLTNNTLLPLFQPFLGKRGHSDEHSSLINRLPRRVVGKHGDAYLCVQCMNEAAESFGFGYWHRSHQAPGVTACWKHGTLLVYRQHIQKIGFVWGKPQERDTVLGKQVRATSMTAFTADFIEYMGAILSRRWTRHMLLAVRQTGCAFPQLMA